MLEMEIIMSFLRILALKKYILRMCNDFIEEFRPLNQPLC